MSKQPIAYYLIALVICVCALGNAQYHRADALRESRVNGSLNFQNEILQRQVKELEHKLETCR